jgi:hypothetical protein
MYNKWWIAIVLKQIVDFTWKAVLALVPKCHVVNKSLFYFFETSFKRELWMSSYLTESGTYILYLNGI